MRAAGIEASNPNAPTQLCVVANDAGLPNVNPAFVLGSELTPISWGLHVASWILKENGK